MFGRLADLFGRKKVFLAGTFWSLAWSLGSGFAPNAIALDVMRALHGMGSAATVPSAVSSVLTTNHLLTSLLTSIQQIGILAHEFPPSRARSIAFATFSAGAPLGAAIGFVIGGVMTNYTRYVHLIDRIFRCASILTGNSAWRGEGCFMSARGLRV